MATLVHFILSKALAPFCDLIRAVLKLKVYCQPSATPPPALCRRHTCAMARAVHTQARDAVAGGRGLRALLCMSLHGCIAPLVSCPPALVVPCSTVSSLYPLVYRPDMNGMY